MSSPVSIFEAISNSFDSAKRLKQGQQDLGQRQQRIDLEKDQENRIAAQAQWENVQHALENGGKPLGPGDLIREDHPMPDLSTIGGSNEGMPSHVPVYRPVDADQEFVASYPGAKGTQPIKVAIPHPDSQKSEKFQKAMADARTRVANSQLAPNAIAAAQAQEESAPAVSSGQAALRQAQLRTSGVPIPDDVADTIGFPKGTKVLPSELPDLRDKAEKVRKERLMPVGPGQNIIDTSKLGAPGASAGSQPGAGGGAVVATGGPQLPTDDFGKYALPAYAKKIGKTVPDPSNPKPTDMDYGDIAHALQDFAKEKKDPQMVDLSKRLMQLHIDQQRQQLGSTPYEVKPGTQEDRVASQLASGRLTFGAFNKLYSNRFNAAKKQGIYDSAVQRNPNFSQAAFEMGQKFADNPKVQAQLASIENVDKAVPDLLKASDAASRTGVKKINQYLTGVGVQLGDKRYSNLNTARMAFADELSGALGYGSATDMSREMGLNMTDKDLSPEAFKSAINDVVVPFVNRKRASILEQMGPMGMPGMGNPAADRAAEAKKAEVPAPLPARLSTADKGKTYISKSGAKLKIIDVNPNDPTQFKSEVVK